MTTEYAMLLASLGLYFVLSLIPAARLWRAMGIAQTGPRDNLPEFTRKQTRDERALANLQESLILFIPLVLMAQHLGVINDWTKYGAEVFFGARVAHAVFYFLGVPVVKSLSYLAGVVGMGMIAFQLVLIM